MKEGVKIGAWIIVGALVTMALSSWGVPGWLIAVLFTIQVIFKSKNNYEDSNRRNTWWK